MNDIDILNVNKDTNKAFLTVSGYKISGVKLLAQRVLLLLLTDMRESLRSAEGTEAPELLVSYSGSINHASMLIASAVSTVKNILIAEVHDDPSEALYDISIQDVNTDTGSINFTLLVTSMSGESDTISSNTGDIL